MTEVSSSNYFGFMVQFSEFVPGRCQMGTVVTRMSREDGKREGREGHSWSDCKGGIEGLNQTSVGAPLLEVAFSCRYVAACLVSAHFLFF